MAQLRRYQLSGDDYLYFHHIPKTAGQTFHTVLERFFKPEQVCPARLWKQLIQIPQQELLQYRLFSGHFYYYINQLLPREPIMVTMLRDPIKRTISHYQHTRRVDELYYHEQAVAGDLHSFVTSPVTRLQVENFQTRIMALTLNPAAIEETWGEEDFNAYKLQHFHHWLDIPTDLPDDALLERAKTRLEQFAFVGLAEHFAESVLLLSHTLHQAPALGVEAINVDPEQRSNSVDSLPPGTLEAIEEATQLDAALYAYGRQLFQSRLQQMALDLQSVVLQLRQETITLQAEVEQLQSANRQASPQSAETSPSLETVWQRFQDYERIRTGVDRMFTSKPLRLIGFPIKLLMRVISMGKVWAAERHLLYEMINHLQQTSGLPSNTDTSNIEHR